MRQPLGKGGEMRPFRAEQASAALCDGPEGYVGQRCGSPCDTCGCSGAALATNMRDMGVRRWCPVGETRRRRRSLLDTWNYLVNKTGPGTERAATRVGPPRRRRRGHSHTAGHVAKNASARAPNERRGAADAEAEGGASSSPRAGRRDSSARDALPQLRQRRTRARRRPSWHRDVRTAPQTRRPRAAPNSTAAPSMRAPA